MRFFMYAFVMLLAFSAPLLAKDVESEKLAPLGRATAKAQKNVDNIAKALDAEAVTPEQQAALVCQTYEIMSGQAGPMYQEGVDAYGNPVVPADGGQNAAFAIPDRVDVPVNIDVMQAMGFQSPDGIKGEANFGTLTVLKSGELLFNGKEITNTVNGYCRTHMNKSDKK